MKTNLLNCTEIFKTFTLGGKTNSRLDVLKGINFSIREAEIVTIVGASGSGKSTFLHILGGLDNPTAGKVYWNQVDISTLGDEAISKLRSEHVGFIFQFHHLLPEFSAVENVMIPMMIRGANKQNARNRSLKLLDKVGLSLRVEHKPSELSGGEQQRVAVARALANDPKIILADEPTGNLDSENGEQLHNLLFTLNKEENRTFIIVTHNEHFARQGDRVLLMTDGKFTSFG